MRKRDIEKIQKELEEEKKDIIKAVERLKQREESYLNDAVGDDIDKAVGNSQREMLFYLTDHDHQRLDAIEDALQKIDEDRYGICEQCGKKIKNDRLKAIPYARMCMKCKPGTENGQ
ncbi:MAG: TraR/DksA family transcriptional regulator [Elusimicrobiota bacterium]